MEKKEIKIFYLGIAQGEIYSGGRRAKKEGLPIRELKERPEYPGGYLRISYAMLPEFAGRSIFKSSKRAWKLKKRDRILQSTLERVRTEGYREVLLSPELTQGRQEVLSELWAACLHSHVPFEQVCVCFSGEDGTFEARGAIMLLSPYLRRIQKVFLTGKEGAAEELLADYLFYEYGIVPERREPRQIEDGSLRNRLVWLDFGAGEAVMSSSLQNLASYPYVNHVEALKFLDTTIKNGYNTES